MDVGRKELIVELAQAMAKVGGEHSRNSGLYTYIGQMISHEIVPNTNPFSQTRLVSPFINLESLYGNEPDYQYLLSGNSIPFMENHKFLLTDRDEIIGDKKHSVVDFCREKQSEYKNGNEVITYAALIPENRNDENVIVAQLHILFLKFHNLLIEKKLVKNALAAKHILILIFQWITIKEFIPAFLHPEICKRYFDQEDGELSHPFTDETMHTFFGLAAFRFGHSSVRSEYSIFGDTSGKPSIALSRLFRKGKKLTPEFKVNWRSFFKEDFKLVTGNNALKVDTHISTGMSNVNEVNVIERNIEAGESMSLKSGYEIYNRIKIANPEVNLKEVFGLELVSDFEKSAFQSITNIPPSQLPLWPYLLLEAEKTPHEETGENKGKGIGEKLGILGSILVADVLKKAVVNAPISIFEKGSLLQNKRLDAIFLNIKDIINLSSKEPLILQMNRFINN